MTIAIDYDGTLKRSSQFDSKETALWGVVIRAFLAAGHQVLICTMRTGNEWDCKEVAEYQRLAGIDLPVVFVGEGEHEGYKRGACKAAGYSVDVWIDDMPESIAPPVALLA